MAYAMYLRKSRADLDAEARGEGETLARHERALTELAHRCHYPIVRTYREIVSGESVANRPQMRRLLTDVAAGQFEGVLVMEVERLARGDTADQARVADTFKYSGTRIITPIKTYDPNNPMDEEYFEFSLFMSRREYKTIVRRMQTGRRLAAKEGKYIASRPPYGYSRIKTAEGWTLAIDPDTAPTVRMIFELYASGMGGGKIAARLSAQGIPSPRGGIWDQSVINRMIRNPVYIGRITWDKRVDTVTGIESGVKQHRRIANADHTDVPGMHPALIDDALFIAANHTGREGSMPLRSDTAVRNPFAGLVKCSLCGRSMTISCGSRRPDGSRYGDRITCPTPGCANHGCLISVLESLVLPVLSQWSTQYAAPLSDPDHDKRAEDIAAARKHIDQLESQRAKLCDFLERGIYDESTFMQRSAALSASLAAANQSLDQLLSSTPEQDTEARLRAAAPLCASAVHSYKHAATPQAQNEALRTVVSRIDYFKPVRGNNRDDGRSTIEIHVFPSIQSSRV